MQEVSKYTRPPCMNLKKPQRLWLILVCALGLFWLFSSARPHTASASSSGPSFVEFESGPVRPLATSPDGNTLFATNIPNGTLEIFDLTSGTPVWTARVPVGLEPVAVAARTNTEVWVVNHLSDSVSVVTLDATPHVTRTLLVGDEPSDIVFAGSPSRAFVTTAHRGQQRTDPSLANVPGAGDSQFTTAGVGRADVWVFDPAVLGNTVGGMPLKVMSFFTDTPRALAVSPDKSTVYVAGYKTGNQTTTVAQERVCIGFAANKSCKLDDGTTSPGGNPGPATDASGEPAPETGLIVKYNNASGHWEDELHRSWDGSVRFKLPDTDVFSVDANQLKQTAAFAHVGTTLFNMAVNPVSGHVYVSNTDAMNNFRFEGPGTFAGHTIQGHLTETHLTVLADGAVLPRHLNKHLDYTKLANAPGFDVTAKDHSLATPLDMAVTSDGQTLYLAAYGSSKIGVFPTAQLEDNSFDPIAASANYIPVSGGGPGGLALDEGRGLLYVMTRFDNSIKAIDLTLNQEFAAVAMPNPEPPSVIAGRPMLYDATRFSGNGEAACASCHQFGDMDDLAWDLGNPDSAVTKSLIPINLAAFADALKLKINGSGKVNDFHPLKGPFTTQTFRGLQFSGAMHWRGDRSVGALGNNAFDAATSFQNFAPAFQDLVGSPTRPAPAVMQQFTNFALQISTPPNPIRNLDNSLTASQQRGRAFYSGTRASDGVPGFDFLVGGKSSFTCDGCHQLDPSQGFYGTGGNQSFENLSQTVKIPHLRNAYAKVGMFGTPLIGFLTIADSGSMGDQVRGFGYIADGSVDTIFRFLNASVFKPDDSLKVGFPSQNPDGTRRDVEQFILAFDTDLAPIVGQQVTLAADNAQAVNPRIDLMISRAGAAFLSKALNPVGATTECDLVARVAQDGRIATYLYDPTAKNFIADDGTARVSDAALRALAATVGQEVTYTAATPGSGMRYLLTK